MVPIPSIQSVDNVTPAAIDLLRNWLARTLDVERMRWLDTAIKGQCHGADECQLGIALGLVGRRIGRGDLLLSAVDLAAAQALRSHWHPEMWGTDEAARVMLVLATWTGNEESFAARVERQCITGELNEHVACLKGFAVFPAPSRLLKHAREAARSSNQAVFEAIACQNPYPADYFDEAAYNQMVIKVLFSGLPIGTIVGLHERRNDDLVRMVGDLVSERRAARRPVPDSVQRWLVRIDSSNQA